MVTLYLGDPSWIIFGGEFRMRKRNVIKRGTHSYAIALTSADMKDFELEEGSVVDIDDINLVEYGKSKKNLDK